MQFVKRYIFFICGIILVMIGAVKLVFFSFEKTEEIVRPSIIVDTSSKEGDVIDNSTYSFVKQLDFKNNISFHSNYLEKRNLYHLSYPNSFENKSSSDKTLYLIGENSYITTKTLQVDDYVSYRQNILEEYKKAGFEKIRVSYSKESKQISHYQLNYLKIEAIGDMQVFDELETVYREEFIVMIKEDKNNYIMISYIATNARLSDEILTNFINSIKIEENKAVYTYSHLENDDLVGSLTITDFSEEENNKYRLSYQIPSSRYEEIESENNDIFATTFRSKDEYPVIISISLQLSYVENPLENSILAFKNSFLSHPDFVLESFEQLPFVYQEKEGIRANLIYSSKEDNNFKRNVSYMFLPLENNSYYTIIMEGNSLISEEMLEDFLHINVQVLDQND